VRAESQEFPTLCEFKNHFSAGRQWLTPVIIATQEAEIRRIVVQRPVWKNSLRAEERQAAWPCSPGGRPPPMNHIAFAKNSLLEQLSSY
jgi:hypothetical protein